MLSTGAIIGISILAVVIVCILTIIISYCVFKRRHDKSKSNDAEDPSSGERTIILTLPDGRKVSISAQSGNEAVNIVLSDFLDINTNSQKTPAKSSTKKSRIVSSTYETNKQYTSLLNEIKRGFDNHGKMDQNKVYETPAGNFRVSRAIPDTDTGANKQQVPQVQSHTKPPVIPPKQKDLKTSSGPQSPRVPVMPSTPKIEGLDGVLPASIQAEQEQYVPEERPEDDYDLIDTSKMAR